MTLWFLLRKTITLPITRRMKRRTALIIAITAGALLTGFSNPRPCSDLAEYKRLPMERRIERMQKSGEDLFKRRRYEDAVVVFETILALDKDDLLAKLWITKARTALLREKQDREKEELIKKYGQLIPKDMIYDNWHWGPSVGHFEVKYSEPKPYVPPVRKVRPKAGDAEVKEALQKAEKSGSAEDYFELAMLHWSRKERDDALKNYFKAVELDRELLGNDDELLLIDVSAAIQEKIDAGKANPEDLFTSGKIELFQGDRIKAIKHLVKSAQQDEKTLEKAKKLLMAFVESPQVDLVSAPPDIFSFRQAYVFDKDSDTIYLRLILAPKNKGQVVPVDLTLSPDSVKEISISSKDAVMAFGVTGISEALRLWIVLPEKDGDFPEYEVKLSLKLDREKTEYLELSNFALAADQPDNWSFLIASEFNFAEGFDKGEYEKNLDGVVVNGYQLSMSDGKGPIVALRDFKEPLPGKLDVWKVMETGGQQGF